MTLGAPPFTPQIDEFKNAVAPFRQKLEDTIDAKINVDPEFKKILLGIFDNITRAFAPLSLADAKLLKNQMSMASYQAAGLYYLQDHTPNAQTLEDLLKRCGSDAIFASIMCKHGLIFKEEMKAWKKFNRFDPDHSPPMTDIIREILMRGFYDAMARIKEINDSPTFSHTRTGILKATGFLRAEKELRDIAEINGYLKQWHERCRHGYTETDDKGSIVEDEPGTRLVGSVIGHAMRTATSLGILLTGIDSQRQWFQTPPQRSP